MKQAAWSETYDGGSAAAEQRIFQGYVREFLGIQVKLQQQAGAGNLGRASHAKLHVGVSNAKLSVCADLPEQFRVGHFQPDRAYPVSLRFSNASGADRPDRKRDLRGLALRIKISAEQSQDLLAANYPTAHVSNARQFVAFSKAMAGRPMLRIPRLIVSLGPLATVRAVSNLMRATNRRVLSLALETYWSRGAILWGDAGPVRFLLRPAAGAAAAPKPAPAADYLRHEMVARLSAGDVVFDLYLQPFVSERKTPIENFAASWREKASPPTRVATLTIPQQDLDGAAGRAQERHVEDMSFNPWYTPAAFRPLGNMNRARQLAYRASSAHRLGLRFHHTPALRNVLARRLAQRAFGLINRFVTWHRLPSWRFALLNLSAFREHLREHNLIDTEPPLLPPTPTPAPAPIPEVARVARTHDGSFNDLSEPRMGSCGSAFGRNMTPVYEPAKFDRPDPLLVSRELLTRHQFMPAKSLNVLAAAWIQFQVHDWANHERFDLGEKDQDIVLPLGPGACWRNHRDLPEESKMRIAGNKVLARAPAGYPIFANIATPWWDGSEVYGADAEKAAELRAGPLLQLDAGYLPTDPSGLNVTGFNEGWWLGLSAMHTLFAREHNLVCKELQRAYASWSDERVYQTARLIVTALIAKIHTVEWTPALLASKPVETALNANWYGLPKDWLAQLGVWLFDAHALKGIPETHPDHHGAPYSLTEEFVSVYRLHPLIPDDYAFFDSQDGRLIELRTFSDIQGHATDGHLRRLGMSNVLYSLGVAHPGAIKLNNYPKSLQKFERLNGELIDLSVVDIVRDRRRGIPRYNDFRRGLRLPRLRDWEELTDDPVLRRKLRHVYGKIDLVDTMIGLFAETVPAGFAFSDTAFRIFILMASRRLQSDRFLTVDFRPEIYSRLGLDWIANNTMSSVILRHCPDLAACLPRNGNAFAPFRVITPAL
jgi:hypothetical protein